MLSTSVPYKHLNNLYFPCVCLKFKYMQGCKTITESNCVKQNGILKSIRGFSLGFCF